MSIGWNERIEFAKEVFSKDALDDAIEWIKANLSPEDVFDRATLVEWAEDNDFVKLEEQIK